MRIKQLRKQRNIKQADLAKAINVSQATMSEYENGKYEPDYETLKKIAAFFDVTIDYLLGNEKKEPTAPKDGEPVNTITFNRNGKVVRKQYSKETWDTIIKMLDAIPEDRLP